MSAATSTANSVDYFSSGRVAKAPNQNVLKALHDSCYISPGKNQRVIQDDDPVKTAAMNEAKRRYEEMVANRKNNNVKHIY